MFCKRMVSSFLELAYNIPSVFCGDDSNWEYLDDRIDSFHGMTFEVPINDYFVDSAVKKNIVIIGDKYLMSDEIFFPIKNYTEFEDIKSRELSYTDYKDDNNFYKVIQNSWPNSNIIRIGDYSNSATELNNLDNIIDYLEGHLNDTIDVLICNGLEGSLLLHDSDVKTKLKQIEHLCYNRHIECYFIFTTMLNNLKGTDYIKFIDENSYRYINVCYVLEWLYKRSLTNSYDNILESLKSITDADYFTFLLNCPDSYTERYNVIVYNYIKRFILNSLGITRDKYYFSVVHRHITTSEYWNSVTYRKGGIYSKIFGRKYYGSVENNKGSTREIDEQGQDLGCKTMYDVHFITKYGTDGHWNLFCNTGYLLAFGVHTEFNEDLPMSLQPQVNCTNEQQAVREGNGVKLNNLMLIRRYRTGGCQAPRELSSITPPIYPTTGCPWLTISDNNLSRYSNKVGTFCPITFYISKKEFTFNIAINIKCYNEKFPDLWQSVTCGKMDFNTYDNYMYPLFAAGGNEALSQDHMQYYPIQGGNMTAIFGNVYNLDMDNICLANSTMVCPTQFNGSVISTFKILSPEGVWKDIFSYQQSAHIQAEFTCGGPPNDFASLLDRGSYIGNSVHKVYPKFSDDIDKIRIKPHYVKEPYEQILDFNTPKDSFIITLNSSLSHGESLTHGRIPYCYTVWDNTMPIGEIELNGKKYLCLPNCWDGRLWWYPWHYGVYNNEWQIDTVREIFDSEINNEQKNIITDRLLIEL